MANISNSLVFMAINYYEADLGKTHKTAELNPCYLSNTHTHECTRILSLNNLLIFTMPTQQGIRDWTCNAATKIKSCILPFY